MTPADMQSNNSPVADRLALGGPQASRGGVQSMMRKFILLALALVLGMSTLAAAPVCVGAELYDLRRAAWRLALQDRGGAIAPRGRKSTT